MRLIAVAVAVILSMLTFGILGAGPARADYEQAQTGGVLEHWGGSQAVPLFEATALAVNERGAGNVESGSFYVVEEGGIVLRYTPGEEGLEPSFREAWGWGVANGAQQYQRCGPAYVGTADPMTEHTFERCEFKRGASSGAERSGEFGALASVAVDQANGNVYVLNVQNPLKQRHLVEVFTASGAPVGEGFGEAGRETPLPAESIEEGPDKLHEMASSAGAIAVDEAGTVYVNDADYTSVTEKSQARVMSFKPCTPNDFEHYCYTGQEHDIVLKRSEKPSRLALAPGGDLVVASPGLLREYAQGSGSGSTPICSLAVAGQLQSMATNIRTGEIFYFTFSGRSIHRLGPCNQLTETFEELQAVPPVPQPAKMWALAFDAGLSWGLARPAGVLYGVDGSRPTGIGDIFVPAKTFPPLVESESTANATATSATLRALVNPNGFATSWYFEYLPASTYAAQLAVAEGEGKGGEAAEDAAFSGAIIAPPSPGTIAAGAAATAAASVAGLAPGTAYRFRVIASNSCNGGGGEPCSAKGQASSFSTYPEAFQGLPDGRAYELVSPPEKHGGEVFPLAPNGSCGVDCKPPGESVKVVFPSQSAPGGDAVAYMGFPFSPDEGAATFNSYISRRTASGWQTTATSPTLLTVRGEDLAFSDGLERGAVLQFGTDPRLADQAPIGYSNIYFQGDTGNPGALTPLIATPPPNRAPEAFQLKYAGYSPDFTRQFFVANDALTGAGLYSPAPPDPGTLGRDLYEWHDGALALVNVLPGNAAVATAPSLASAIPSSHAVSENGRRVFWKAGGSLYVREDGQITRKIDQAGEFLAASPDGLQVLLSDGCLYSLLTEACTDLTQGQGGFKGIAGASENLSDVYFVDGAALKPGAEAGTCSGAVESEENEGKVPPSRGCNLYLYRAGIGTTFIATLMPSDGSGGPLASKALNDWGVDPNFQPTAEASPDGRYLSFGSRVPLTGAPNIGLCGQQTNSEHETVRVKSACAEIFIFDSATGRLTCASCNPTGEAPLGPSLLPRVEFAPKWQPQPRYLTDAGRLFFDSPDRLALRDRNGEVEDVYEYEPTGVGSCAAGGGCVSLISSGTGSVDSNFLAADASGANVFFTSRERLVKKDNDELIDLYDAREGGGFAEEGAGTAGACQGEGCQGPAPSSPAAPSAATQSFQGPGNPKPTGEICPKGKVKKKGKCVKKASHPKKHAKKKRAKRRSRANLDRGGNR